MARTSIADLAMASDATALYLFGTGALTTDSSGNGKTLTAVNSPAEIAMDFGNGADLGTANSNKRFTISAATLGVNLINNWGMVYRFRCRTEVGSGQYGLLRILDDAGKAILYVDYQYNSGTRRIVISQDRWVITGIPIVTSNQTLGTASEHDLVITKQKNTYYVYLDNVLLGKATDANFSTIGDTNPGNTVYIGSNPSGDYSSIAIDELGFWTREVTRTEVGLLNTGAASPATLPASVATYISAQSATSNFRFTHDFLTVGEWKGGTQQDRGVIKFGLADIPAAATITSAVLRIYDEGVDYSDNTRTMRVYRIKRAVNLSETTWNVYSTGNNWGTAGAGNTTSDREATDIGSISMPATEVAQYYEITLDATKIQEMLTGGVFTNNGFLLQFDTESNDMHQFSDETDTNYPQLVITYSVADPATVTTDSPATSITSNSAQGGGEVTDDGGATVTERGIAWGTSPNPTIAGDHVAAGAGGVGTFGPLNMTGLDPDTHYYYRAYATNSEGTSYGSDVEFDTLDAVISGTCVLSGSPVSGAKITLIDSDTDAVVATDTSDGSGNYAFLGLDVTKTYHVTAEYDDGGGSQYNALSLPYMTPEEV